MKQALYLLAAVALLASCKNGTNTAASKSDSTVMPYKATYSSSWQISDSAKVTQAVLQSYKDWEENKLANAPAYYADTVSWIFADGSSYRMRRDSLVHFLQKVRDSLSSSKIEIVSVINLYSTDKKAEWVGVWYKQTDTYKSGKKDSAAFNDVNEVKNGKVVFWSSYRQALKKAN
jgi:hypothetical protein